MQITVAPLRLFRRSALEAASCLKRFHEVIDLGLEDSSPASRRGVAFHHIALREYVPALVRMRVTRSPRLLEEAFRRGIVAVQCPPNLVAEVEDLVFAWGERFELDLDAFLMAEERQVTNRVDWTPDLVYAYRNTPTGSLLLIVDQKTYYAILGEAEVRDEFQVQVYVRNAMQQWPGFDRYGFEMQFVRYNRSVFVEFKPEELESLDRRVRAIIGTIEDATAADHWPAQPGDHCGYCRLKCDAADDPRVIDRRAETYDEAQVVLGRVLALRRMIDSDMAMLRAYTTTEGPVRLGDAEVAHRQTIRSRYPALAVLEVLERHAFAPPPGLAFSKTALEQILDRKLVARRHPELVAEVKGLAVESATTRFGIGKAGNQEREEAPAGE